MDASTMIGAQASNDQLEKILSYIEIGKGEGARVLTGGKRAELGGRACRRLLRAADGSRRPQQDARVPGRDLRPVVSVTTFEDDDEALAIANDTLYGLGSGVWTRNGTRAYRMGRAIQAGRVWDQLLPCLSGACRVRWLQAVGHRPRDAQDDARPLSADEEHARQLQPEGARLLLRVAFRPKKMGALSGDGERPFRFAAAGNSFLRPCVRVTSKVRRMTTAQISATPEARDALARAVAEHGPVMFHTTGGRVGGRTFPICLPIDWLRIGARDHLLGEVEGAPIYEMEDREGGAGCRAGAYVLDVAPGPSIGFSHRGGLGQAVYAPARGSAGLRWCVGGRDITDRCVTFG